MTMQKTYKLISFFMVSGLVIFGQQAKIPILKSLQIITRSEHPKTYSIPDFDSNEHTVNIDTESDSDQFDIKIGLASKNTKINVEQRYETSLTIQDEGPHLDLIDWKHYVSNWVVLHAVSVNAYKSILISREESRRFPSIDMSEVLNEIKRHDKRWLGIAQRAASINDSPFAIGVSKVSFRFSRLVGNRWVPFYVVHCMRPMGC